MQTLTLSSAPNSTFRIEFFANDPDPLGLPAEGQQFLGFSSVTTDASGNVLPSGVSAILEGFGPVGTLDRTEDTAPLLRSIVKELTNWSPLVATHMNPVPDVVPLFAVEQLLKTITGITASSARTHERMRIPSPRRHLFTSDS